MATIKSFTDLEQSKRLAGILPPESADLCYEFDFDLAFNTKWKSTPIIIEKSNHFDLYSQDIPCWSQAALYNMLPVVIGNLLEKNALRLRMDKGETDFNVWYDNLDTGSAVEGLDIVESNPVDAYYKMIVKLHEQKLL